MEEVRRNWPFLRDRRIDAYAPIVQPVCSIEVADAASCGYRMPAEWEPHEATWLAWPHNASRLARQVRADPLGVWRNRAQAGARGARAHPGAERRARKAGAPHSRRSAAPIWMPSSSSAPDRPRLDPRLLPALRQEPRAARSPSPPGASTAGPSTTTGARTPPCPAFLAKRLKLPRLRRRTWCSKAAASTSTGRDAADHRGVPAQPGAGAQSRTVSRDEIERALGDYLGVERVIWLNNGIAGDDTHGHIDDLARFVNPDTVVAVRRERRRPTPLTLQRAPGSRWCKLPMPRPLWFDGQRLPASYANFYIANGLVLVPTFNDPNDRVALGILASCSPTAKWSASTAPIWSGAWARCTA